MTTPDWLKPGLYGALIGAILVAALGFTLGGWVTGRTANAQAMEMSRDEKMETIRAASSYERRNALMAGGWATVPGTDGPDRDIAQACLAALEL